MLDVDIWRSAHVMLKRYGEIAALEAAQRADQLLDDGDLDGYATWRLIIKAIEELQRPAPAAGGGTTTIELPPY